MNLNRIATRTKSLTVLAIFGLLGVAVLPAAAQTSENRATLSHDSPVQPRYVQQHEVVAILANPLAQIRYVPQRVQRDQSGATTPDQGTTQRKSSERGVQSDPVAEPRGTSLDEWFLRGRVTRIESLVNRLIKEQGITIDSSSEQNSSVLRLPRNELAQKEMRRLAEYQGIDFETFQRIYNVHVQHQKQISDLANRLVRIEFLLEKLTAAGGANRGQDDN